MDELLFCLSDFLDGALDMLWESECINFQGNIITLKELLTPTKNLDFDDIIDILFIDRVAKEEVVNIGRSIGDTIRGHYVPRKCLEFGIKERFQKEVFYSEEDLCKIKNDRNIFSIDCLTGSGRTYLLADIACVAKREFPDAWVISMDLKDYWPVLPRLKENQTRPLKIEDLLNSIPQTRLTTEEMNVFSIKEKVILTIDGVEESLHEYKVEVLDILKNCARRQNFRRVFITTSPGLDEEFKDVLRARYPLVPFSGKEKVEVLRKYWMESFAPIGDKIERSDLYAETLIAQNWFVDDNNSVVAVPLLLEMLSTVFSTKRNFIDTETRDWEGWMEFLNSATSRPILPANISIVELYQLFIFRSCCRTNTCRRSVRKDIQRVNEECENYLYILALESVLTPRQRKLFDIYQNRPTMPAEKLQNFRILRRIDGQFQFTHATFADYFVAECIAAELQTNERQEFASFLFEEVCMSPRFSIVRKMLDSFVDTDLDRIGFTTTKNIKVVLGSEDNHRVFAIFAEEGNLNLFKFPFRYSQILGSYSFSYFRSINYETVPHMAMARNQFNIVRFMVENGGADEVTFKDDDDRTLLHIAAKRNNLEAVTFLVEHDAEVDCKDTMGRTPLHEAAKFGSLELLNFLLSKGAVVNRRDRMGHTALHDATRTPDSFAKVKALIEYKAQVDSTCHCPNMYCLSPIFAAVREGNLDTVKCLVENGADLFQRNSAGHFILHYFLDGNKDNGRGTNGPMADSVAIARLLFNKGVDLNMEDLHGNPVLHSIINKHDNVGMVNFLREVNALFRGTNNSNSTPADIAVEMGAINILHYLLETPLEQTVGAESIVKAAGEGHLEVLRYLVRMGIDLKVENKTGTSPLHQAIIKDQVETVIYLVEQGVSLTGVTHDGSTVAMLALKHCEEDLLGFLIGQGLETEGMLEVLIKQGKLGLVRFLVEQGQTVEQVDKVGDNLELLKYLTDKGFNIDNQAVLYFAAQDGNLDIIRYLLGRAQLRQGYNGSTVLHAAAEKNHLHVVRYLLKLSVPVDIKDEENRTPLHVAVAGVFSITDTIVELVERGADVNAADSSGDRPLCLATSNRNFEVIKFLIEKGANPEMTNRKGDTPFMCALRVNAMSIADYLVQKTSNGRTTIVEAVKPIVYGITHPTLGRQIASHVESLEYLVDRGFQVTDRLCKFCRILTSAVDMNRYKLVRRLLIMGVNMTDPDRSGFSSLHVTDNLGILKLLLANDANPNTKGPNDISVLHKMVGHAPFEVSKLLIEKGADINAATAFRETVIHHAGGGGRYSIVKYLLDRGVELTYDTSINDGSNFLGGAAGGGDLDIVKLLVDRGAIVTDADHNLVHRAIEERALDILKFVLEKGAPVDAMKSSDLTRAVQRAADEGHYNMARVLLEAGASVDSRNEVGATALHDACTCKDLEMVKLLIKHHADVNAMNLEQYTPLHTALKTGPTLSMVSTLIANGAVTDTCSVIGRTPLHDVVYKADPPIVNYFLDLICANINAKELSGNALLHEAAGTSNMRMTELLLTKGANVNLGGKNNKTALGIAAGNGCIPLVELLIEYGADVNAMDDERYTPLHDAARHGCFHEDESHLRVMRLLVAKGAMVNLRTNRGRTPLHCAAFKCDLPKIRFLVENGCRLNKKTEYGSTPFMEAIMSREREDSGRATEIEVVRYFIEQGANAFLPFQKHNMVLMSAVKGDLEAVRYLVDLGVELRDVPPRGNNALHQAAKSGCVQLARYLVEEQGFDVNARGGPGNTPLHYTVAHMKHDMMRYLVSVMEDVNIRDNKRRTALHLAAETNDLVAAKVLVEAGADINLRDRHNKTPLAYAYGLPRDKQQLANFLLSLGGVL